MILAELREVPKEVWCQIEPEDSHEPWDLSIYREKCKRCKVKDNCVHWVELEVN